MKNKTAPDNLYMREPHKQCLLEDMRKTIQGSWMDFQNFLVYIGIEKKYVISIFKHLLGWKKEMKNSLWVVYMYI